MYLGLAKKKKKKQKAVDQMFTHMPLGQGEGAVTLPQL